MLGILTAVTLLMVLSPVSLAVSASSLPAASSVGGSVSPVASASSATVGKGLNAAPGSSISSLSASTLSPSAASAAPASFVGPSGVNCPSLKTAANDPVWAATIRHTKALAAGALASGVPSADLPLPYLGAYPDQVVNGVLTPGDLLSAECRQSGTTSSYPLPAGIAYDGQNDTNGVIQNSTLDSNSVAGILNVNSSSNFYPNSATPTQWGGQLNVVLANVTILGQRGYFFWVQNVIAYDTANDTISFVDDTWNFTSYYSEMLPSSLVSWSPDGGDYSGTWVAFSPYIYCPPPFTVTTYVNSSVNAAGDQVLWYNYSVLTQGHFYADGTYDYLEFNSQAPSGPHQTLAPAPFEASGTQTAVVTEGYEFDAFLGADDGSNNLILGANATEQLKYCSLAPSNDCTPTHFAYSSVPAAVNYGSQTGESTVGVAVNYVGETAYLSAGPLLARGLWNYTAEAGDAAGNTEVVNAISVSGSPLALTAQPYFFVFFENPGVASEGYGWAPDVPVWYLSAGTWNYTIMLADYAEQNGTIVVGSSPVTLTAVLPYSPDSGVYTPLWAFNNAQVAGISSSGAGTVSDQYVLFNNPTSSCIACDSTPDANLSSAFFSANDYSFPSFSGLFLSGTNAYIDVNAAPTFCVFWNGTTGFYLNLQFYRTSNVTLSHAQGIRGWPEMQEISFYALVPASQNPAPQADVYVWNSTHDLIMSNTFVAVAPALGAVSPDQLVLYGGSGNVVWGNTFEDPPNTTLGASYAGIGEAEGGDLLYNNNLSIDNPVVYLPYNFPNVADCLPQSLGGCANNETGNPWYYNLFTNTWNVTPQAASNVVETVNGFSLSGNVLGSFYPTQGGNYYWNYGTSPNNYSTNPYVSRFLYTNWSLVYPLGCGSIQAPGAPCGTPPPVVPAYQNGMHSGGDDAPLLLALSFREVGLVPGTNWSASLNGQVIHANGSVITWGSLETGTYRYTVASVPGYIVFPSSGTIDLTGPISTPTTITFMPMYPVTFTETGLPSGTNWTVTLNGTPQASTTSTIVFLEVNGSYAFSVRSVAGYNAVLTGGSVFVKGAAFRVSVPFMSTAGVPQFLGMPADQGYALLGGIIAVVIVVGVVVALLIRRRGKTPPSATTTPSTPSGEGVPPPP